MEDDDEIGGLPQEYVDFQIMRMMGWDWWTFHRQPSFFIDMIEAFIWAETEASATINKRNK